MSQMELRSVPALKKEIIRLALAAAVQLLFALWFYAFCCGLLSLGPLRLPYGVKGYEFGGMICVLSAFMPVRTVWNLNEAVDEAKKLLRTTDRSVSDIAVDCGFESFSYFSTVFKKVVGITPVQYRKEGM